jgi:hypothetical protein
MRIPLIGNIIDHIKGKGAQTGLNQTSNSFKMAAYLLAPFLVGFIVAKTVLPPQLEDTATLIVFVSWIVGIILFYSNAKQKAASFLPFPQSHWFFPDGQQISYDLMVPEKGYEELAEYSDGSKLYRVYFRNRCAYQETDRPYPDIFDHALWKLPTNWNDTFKRNGAGEFFFENLFITHPACENIQVSVIEWDERGSYRLPLCAITGCSYWAERAIKDAGKNLSADDYKKTMKALAKQKAYVSELKAKNTELATRNMFLEKEHEEYVSNEPKTIKKLADDRLEAIIKRDSLIRYAKKSIWTRILNLKTFAYAIILTGITMLISHFFFGWP